MLQELLDTAADLSSYGVMSKIDMARVRALCEPPPKYTPDRIVSIRTTIVKATSSLNRFRASSIPYRSRHKPALGARSKAVHVGWAVNLTPKARATFMTVSNLGLAPGASALYKLSRPKPASLATCAMPLARATSPTARWQYAQKANRLTNTDWSIYWSINFIGSRS
jgi:hypothetical protein